MKSSLTPTVSLLPLLLSGWAMGAHAADPSHDHLSHDHQQQAAQQHHNQQQELPLVQVKAKRDTGLNPINSSALHTPTPLRETPQSVSVVTEAVLDSQNATTLKDALRNVAGLTFSAGEGGAIGDSINLRGFSARTDLFVDGQRDRAQINRDSSFYKQVEVLKGSSAMAFGRGGVGGVVNQALKHAQEKPVAEVGLALGSENDWRATVDMNQKLTEDVYGRISAYGQSRDSTRDTVESEKSGVLLSGRADLSDKTKVTATVMAQHTEQTPDFGMPFFNGVPAPVDKANFYGLASDRYQQDSQQLLLKVEHKASPALTLRSQLSYAHSEVDAMPTAASIAATELKKPLDQVVVTRARRERQVTDENVFSQSELVWRIADSMGWKHMVLLGGELGRERQDVARWNWSGLPNANLLNPNANDSLANAKRVAASTASTTADTQSVYLQDQLKLNEQFQVLAGVRWDRFDADYTLVDLTKTSANRTTFAQRDEALSYRAGAVFTPQANSSYYLSYGTAFTPSAEALTISAANAKLDPEESRTLETGAKWLLLNDRLGLNVAVFEVKKTHMRTPDPLDASLNLLDGAARTRGAEVEINGRPLRHLQILASYAYLDSEILSSRAKNSAGIAEQGHAIANTPEHSASLWSLYDIGRNWQVGGGVFYMGERFANNYGSLTVPSYTRLDATAAYRHKDYDLRLNLKNLSDETIYEEISGGRAIPAEGRTAQVSLAYRF